MKKAQRFVLIIGVLVSLLMGCSPTEQAIPTLMVFPSETATLEPTMTATEASLPSDSVITPEAETVAVSTEPAATIAADTPAPRPTTTIGETEPGAEPISVQPPIVAVPDRVMLTFNVNASPVEREQYIAQLEAVGASVSVIPNLNTIVVDKPATVELPENPALTTSETDYYAVALHDGAHPEMPNDPRLSQQWGYSVTRALDGWLHLDLSQPAIVVAVIDSGICQHTELQGRMVDGYDFVQNDNMPQDEYGHGCSVAGIIAATTNDGIGIAGIAPNTVIMPLRVLDANGIGRYSDVASAIVYAVDNGAQIINLSLGGSAASAVLESAVQYAVDHDVQVIAAAGNSGIEGALYPAAYPPVVAVGAIDADLKRSSFSNYGAQVDTYAPGRDIISLSLDGTYRYVTGTSFAAPHVAGIAAIEMAFGQQLVLDGGIATVGGVAAEPIIETPPTPVESTPTTTPAFPSLLVDTEAQGALNVATALGVMRSRYVEINHNAISTTGAQSLGAQSARQDTIVINLFDDVQYTAVFDEVLPHEAIPDGFIWIGRILEDPDGEVILTMGDGLMEGSLRAQGKLYQITYAGNGIHAVNEINETVYRSLHVNPKLPPAADLTSEASANAETSMVANENMTVIDVMIVYSTLARNGAGGDSAMMNQIATAVTQVNRAYHNSGVNIRLRLVHSGLVTYSGDSDADLDRLTYSGGLYSDMDIVHTWRNTYGADLVALISENGSYCGIGWMMQTGGTPSQASEYGFSVTVRDCLPGGLTVAHEFGHNQGLAHDVGESVGLTPAYPYGYGYIDPQGFFRTIMAYSTYCPANTPCSSINYFSNPDLSFNGRVLGTATTNETRALNDSAARVAAFRSPTNMVVTPTPTVAPPIENTPTPIPTGTAIPTTCTSNAGTVAALITAINSANATAGTTDVICLTASTYNVTTGPTASSGSNAFPIITSPIIINGNGATIQRSGTNNFRFFYINGTGSLNLQNVNLSNGRSSLYDGGAIYNAGGSITVVNSTLQNNLTLWWGGAIYSTGSVTVSGSLFTGNSARTGGAIYSQSSIVVTASDFVENFGDDGSAIYYGGSGSSNVTQNCFVTNSNTSVGVNPDASNLNAPSNWWNSNQGPATTMDGNATNGDIASTKVNYSPYLVRPPARCADVTAPELLTPLNGVSTNANITFSWSVVDGAVSYRLQIATDNAFSNIVADNTYTDTSVQPVLPDNIYYWRVNSSNGTDNSEWSATFSVTLDTTVPDTPSLLSPANGSNTSIVQPGFTWMVVGGAVKYEIVLENSNPPDVTYTVTSANFTPSTPLITDTTYYWAVRAQDAAGNWSDWTTTTPYTSVTIDTPVGATPIRNYFNTNPTIRWSPLSWAIAYEIQIDNNSNFSSPEYTAVINNGTSRSLTFTLANDGLYFWRIRAANSSLVWGTWSSSDSFLYDQP